MAAPLSGGNGAAFTYPGAWMRLTRHEPPGPGVVEVAVELEPLDLTRPPPVECLWAEALSERTYRLRSIPFYAYGFSRFDIVEVECGPGAQSPNRSPPRIARAVKRSGHSTYRLMVRPSIRSAAFLARWEPLAALGCGYEAANRHFVAVDVPPRAPEYRVRALFAAGQEANVWRLDEALDEHPAAS